MAFQVDCVVKGTDRLGECPIWCDRENVLWWVDSRGPSLKRCNPVDGEVRNTVLPSAVSTVTLNCGTN